MENFTYCNSLLEYTRLQTKTVVVGGVPMGGQFPIRLQTMTNTPTLDTRATVEQIKRVADTGADYVRLTAQSMKEAENISNIKKLVRAAGYSIPIIVDVHFNPKIAELAAQSADKVRINPGNYVDNSNFSKTGRIEKDYGYGIEKIRQSLLPLLSLCKQNGTALRIGTNHGSLSQRIMDKYGDTPAGMVEATLEFLRICVAENFHNLVVSLKSSNTIVMVEAYRLMAHNMIEENLLYPIHLGVTEAGEGEDGRIKSAVGIGALLADGIGDTIRVSLTEPPEAEIPVAQQLVGYITDYKHHKTTEVTDFSNFNPFVFSKRRTNLIHQNIGANNPPIVITSHLVSNVPVVADYIFSSTAHLNELLPEHTKLILDGKVWNSLQAESDLFESAFPLFNPEDYILSSKRSKTLNFIFFENNVLSVKLINQLQHDQTAVIILDIRTVHGICGARSLFMQLMRLNLATPVILYGKYLQTDNTDLQLAAAVDFGSLLMDGFGEGVWIEKANATIEEHRTLVSTAFNVLQACRQRISKAEYISCPSCGRTNFDLQTVCEKIRNQTNHLTGLKIAIMGCIVNGLGEMADADYGYVGTGIGMVTLYKGKTSVKQRIPEEKAVDELIALIKNNGDWREK